MVTHKWYFARHYSLYEYDSIIFSVSGLPIFSYISRHIPFTW